MINPTCVDFILELLDELLEESILTSEMEDQCVELKNELKYLKFYMMCLAKWNESSFEMDKNFGFVEESHIESAFEEVERKFRMFENDSTDRVSLVSTFLQTTEECSSELLEIIEQCKLKIKEDCLSFLDCSFHCEFSIDELPEFMRSISASLHNLLDLKANMILDVKVQIESLKDNLDLFQEIFYFTAKRCSSHEDLKDFKIHIQAWACNAACLSLLYWVQDVKNENMPPRMDVILSDLLKKISPSSPKVTRMYLGVLKSSKPSADDNLMVSELVLKFVEFLKDNLKVVPEKDVIQMLFIELIFLITFLMDRPELEMYVEEGKLIFTRANAVVNDVVSLITSLSASEIEEDIAEERNFLLLDFLQKANAIKAEVRKLYAHLFLDPSSFNFPRINVFGFIDSLLEELEGFCSHFPEHPIVMLQQELLFLKESNLKEFSILELQNKHKDVKDLWTRIINVAYHAERVFISFIYMKESLWHDIVCLFDVIEEIKLIMGEEKRIKDQHMCDIHALNSETTSNPLLPLQANSSIASKIVGFKNEVEEIINRLIAGSLKLDIVSIVGMPGLGKTSLPSLAKKVFSDPSNHHHFNKIAWCTVSQTFYIKGILLDILRDVTAWDDKFDKMTEEDLAQGLQKCLRGQKYLIVMDDIWDISAWNALKLSSPDDKNGSRIMFTSRIHNVAVKAKPDHSPFPLNPLSEEDSWELLKYKIFDQDSCPPNFVEIGKQIARNCKGLPLTIVLTSGLLKEKLESMDWWKQVGERVESLIAYEGCTDILEISYKHLPEFLRPCFVYFGSLPEHSKIRVKKLTQLWISEGFIPKHEKKSLELVAKEYLMDLVVRSLVIVTKISSTGGIKTCRVHDLLHDFCLRKCQEEKLFKVVNEDEVSYHPISMAATYVHYRVSIQTKSWRFLEHIPPAPCVHSLMLPQEIARFSRGGLDDIPYLAFTKLIFLQVLELNFDVPIGDFPEAITALVLLRYLAIPCDNGCIPPSIKRLQNLETFRVFNFNSLELPVAILEMQKLRHVEVKGYFEDGCTFSDVCTMAKVQTFTFLVLFYGEEVERVLRKIFTVRKLQFELIFDTEISNQILKLDFLSHLESLYVIHGHYSTHTKLHSCAFYFPATLKKLKLQEFGLPWSEISAISKLPNLEVLKLHMNAFCGSTWNVGDDEFLKLKFLELNDLDTQQLNASEDSFPCLARLVVKSCDNLEEIPSRFGRILSLKMIQIKNCRSTLNNSAEQIQEEQVELGNEHLEILIFGAS